jgi:hypothetical protein
MRIAVVMEDTVVGSSREDGLFRQKWGRFSSLSQARFFFDGRMPALPFCSKQFINTPVLRTASNHEVYLLRKYQLYGKSVLAIRFG